MPCPDASFYGDANSVIEDYKPFLAFAAGLELHAPRGNPLSATVALDGPGSAIGEGSQRGSGELTLDVVPCRRLGRRAFAATHALQNDGLPDRQGDIAAVLKIPGACRNGQRKGCKASEKTHGNNTGFIVNHSIGFP